jgi:hypothetical protein
MKYFLLLVLGVSIFVIGLLNAAHKPFQDWRLAREKKSVKLDSEEYRTAIFNMKISGSGLALIGGLLTIDSLGELGGEKLILVAGIFFVIGLLFAGAVRLATKWW